MFGSSGHLTRPEGSTLAAYVACYPLHHPENHHVKTIANMAYVDCVGGDPHHFTYLVRIPSLPALPYCKGIWLANTTGSMPIISTYSDVPWATRHRQQGIISANSNHMAITRGMWEHTCRAASMRSAQHVRW